MIEKPRNTARAVTCALLASALGLPPAARADEDAAFSKRAIAEARRELDALVQSGEISLEEPVFPTEPTTPGVAQTPLSSPSGRAQRRARKRRAHALKRADAQWLRSLELPDIQVRWDDRLVDLLTYYKEDPKGQALMQGLYARSGRYEAMAKEKLREAGLPEALYYVAMVESGYTIDARSGAGAVGMWQFVASTATDYGLRVDRWADQRLSPDHATDAAIRFFANLHGRLRSWPLSLAAYNMGYGALLRSIRKYNSNDFWVLSNLEAGLPYETVSYVTKVTACAIVAKNPAVFGLTDKESPTEGTLVEVPGGVSLGRLARAAGVTTSMLIEMNPELSRKRIPPDAVNWPLRIPRASLPRFLKRWPQANKSLVSHRKHILRLGETFSDVAQIYGTSESRLLALNEMESSAGVRPGAVLRVPDVDAVALEVPERPMVGVPQGHFRYENRKQWIYRVVDGDRLDEIARFFGVAVAEMVRWNDVAEDAALTEGMYLQVFAKKGHDMSRVVALRPQEVNLLVVGSEKFFNSHEESQDRKRIRYRVQQGDTLATLSKRFGLSVGSIARINQFSRYRDPAPDTEIILYVPNEK